MLTNKTYLTKVLEAETQKRMPVEPKPEVEPPIQKSKPVIEAKVEPKIEPSKSPTQAERIAALEKVVYSAFKLNSDGTTKRLKRNVQK